MSPIPQTGIIGQAHMKMRATRATEESRDGGAGIRGHRQFQNEEALCGRGRDSTLTLLVF